MPHSESKVIGVNDGPKEAVALNPTVNPKKLPPIQPNKTKLVRGNALPPRPPASAAKLSTAAINESSAAPRPPLPPNAPAKQITPKVVKRHQPNGSVLSKLAARPEFKSAFAHTKLDREIGKPIDATLRIPSPSRSITPTDLDHRHLNLSRSSSLRSLDSSRCISPISIGSSNLSSISSTYDNSRHSHRLLTPRRIFPQTYTAESSSIMSQLRSLEQSPTIFNGRMSFDLGSSKQRIRQEFRASPAHSADAETASRYLSSRIESFLKRTDHVNEEWKNLKGGGRGSSAISMIEDQRSLPGERLGRSRSVTNIMIKGYRMVKDMPPTERSHSVSRDLSRTCSQDTLIDGFDEVKLNQFNAIHFALALLILTN